MELTYELTCVPGSLYDLVQVPRELLIGQVGACAEIIISWWLLNGEVGACTGTVTILTGQVRACAEIIMSC